MNESILSRESIRKAAEEHYLAGKTLDEIPDPMKPFEQDFAQEYRLCQFELDCGRAA
jgi:hypothetical protein